MDQQLISGQQQRQWKQRCVCDDFCSPCTASLIMEFSICCFKALISRYAAWLQVLCSIVERSGECCVALHNGRVYVERLVKAPDPARRPLEPNHRKTIVVTGGTKGLGSEYTKQVSAIVHELYYPALSSQQSSGTSLFASLLSMNMCLTRCACAGTFKEQHCMRGVTVTQTRA